jgi:hypothetical protein
VNEQTRAKLDGIQRTALVVGVLATIAVVVGALQDPHQFFRSYLYAYFVPFGLAVGALGLTMLHYLTGGFWGQAIRRLLQASMRTIPFVALLFVPIGYAMLNQPTGSAAAAGEHGNFWIYPWTDAKLVAGDRILQHKAQWLEGQFAVGRAILYFVIWFGFAAALLRNAKKWDETGDPKADVRTRVISGPGLVIFFLVTSAAVLDWAMSVEPKWFSTMYALIFIVGQALAFFAFSILFLSRVKDTEPFARFVKPQLFHDLATLLFATVMLWAYTSFSQFLIIWSGNLQEEAPWYIVRTNPGWELVGVSLALLHFAVPFFLLLHRRIKRDASLVPFIAVLLLVMRFVDLYWQVQPAYHKSGAVPHWLDFATPIALVGLWLAFFVNRLKSQPLTSPREATSIEAAFQHAHPPVH